MIFNILLILYLLIFQPAFRCLASTKESAYIDCFYISRLFVTTYDFQIIATT